MSSVGIFVRRTLAIAVLAVAIGAAVRWWRDRAATSPSIDPPVWPPLEPSVSAAPDPASPAAWLESLDDGSAPSGHPVKVRESSGIFHVPGGRFYDRTHADRCYATTDAAEADGYRRSKA